MPQWPRAVLVDFDGVLVNSEPIHFRTFRDVLRAEKIEISEREYYEQMIGFDDRGAFRHAFESRGMHFEPKDLLRLAATKGIAMMEVIRREGLQPLPGVDEFVRGLWWNYPLAICSGGRLEEIEATLECIGLRDCFAVITSAEHVTCGKPDPEGYLLTAERLSQRGKGVPLKPSDCLVIEDAPTVIRACKDVGFPVLGVATSQFPDKLDEANADWVVKSLDTDEVKKRIPQLKVGV